MTSKISFFKMVKNDILRRLWVLAILWLGFFAVLPLNGLLRIGIYHRQLQQKIMTLPQMMQNVANLIGPGNTLVLLGIACSAVVIGMTGFGYLHSAKKTDLFHALPIKRRRFFAVQYVSGLIIFAIPYLVNLLLLLVVCIVKSTAVPAVFSSMFAGIIIHGVYFLMLYHLTIIAVVLTGKLLVGILGLGMFWGYSILASILLEGYMSQCFSTYYNAGQNWFQRLCVYLSPIALYMEHFNKFYDDPLNAFSVLGENWKLLLIVLVETLLLLELAMWLYKKRPSEMAGQSIAFAKIKPVIKIMLIVLLSAAGGLFFVSMSDIDSIGWLIFGILFTAVIVHCVVEVIYSYDFKQIICHKVSFASALAVTLILALSMWYDWYGYDTRVPAESNIKTMAMSIYNINQMTEYPWNEDTQESAYLDSQMSYVMKYGQMEDITAAYALAETGARNEASDEWSKQDRKREISVITAYTMKNGKVKIRNYTVTREQLNPYLKPLFETEGFRAGEYPAMTVDAAQAEIDEVYFTDAYHEDDQVKMTLEQARELLAAYQEEFTKASYEELSSEHVVGSLSFRGKDYNPIAATCYLYDSFEKTLELLKQYGYEPQAVPEAERVNEITVYKAANGSDIYDDYAEYEDNATVTTYTDPDQIREILSSLLVDQTGRGEADPNCTAEVSISYDNGKGVSYIQKSYTFKKGEVADFILNSSGNTSREEMPVG